MTLSFQTPGYEDLELSTQILIKEALKRNIEVEVLDRSQNFIGLTKNGKTEFIKQATRTSNDTYIAALVMENKQVTKRILEKKGIRIPKGQLYYNKRDAIAGVSKINHQDIVVKPNNTNFGIGISILQKQQTKVEYEKAIINAFEYDSSILLEKFIPGKEYRFLIIENEVVAILHRVAANIKGDGIHSIKQLVALKNQNPIRGKGYIRPLEKILLGDVETKFLALQGLNERSILKAGEIVFLRKNSNISTGGDSIDFTDDIIDAYKKIAVEAAQAVGAKICGADIVIQDIHQPPTENNYAVIELNFNPALHIHNYPYQGKNRQVEKKILNLLKF